MSTRGLYTFKDANETIQVYVQSDNYPDGESGGISKIKKAVPFAWPLPRYEPDEFAGAFVYATKQDSIKYGGGHVRLIPANNYKQGDMGTEYEYIVTKKDKKLWIEFDDGGKVSGYLDDLWDEYVGKKKESA